MTNDAILLRINKQPLFSAANNIYPFDFVILIFVYTLKTSRRLNILRVCSKYRLFIIIKETAYLYTVKKDVNYLFSYSMFAEVLNLRNPSCFLFRFCKITNTLRGNKNLPFVEKKSFSEICLLAEQFNFC